MYSANHCVCMRVTVGAGKPGVCGVSSDGSRFIHTSCRLVVLAFRVSVQQKPMHAEQIISIEN